MSRRNRRQTAIPVQGVVGLIRAYPAACGIVVLVAVLGVGATMVPWPDVTVTPTLSTPETVNPEPPPEPPATATATPRTPTTPVPAVSPDQLSETQQRIAEITGLQAQLPTIDEVKRLRRQLEQIKQKHPNAFTGFNFEERDLARAEIRDVIAEFEDFPLNANEMELLQEARSAAESEYSVPAEFVYGPAFELAEKLLDRQQALSEELHQLRDAEQRLLSPGPD